MKAVAKRDLTMRDDPKPMDRPTWNRIRKLVEEDAIHRDWGCALYALHKLGRINNDERDAGDRYGALVRDHRKLWRDPIGFAIDVPNQQRDYDARCKETQPVVHALGLATAEGMRCESEFETERAKRISKRYREAAFVAGGARNILESLLIDEVWPVGERGHKSIKDALTRLSHFFYTGTKRKR